MKKKLVIYISFFVLLTAGFLYLVYAGTDNWKPKLPVLSKVKPFEFTTQDGAHFTQRDMQGKVCVVEYFFTTCKGICPELNNNMRTIYNDFKDRQDFMIVSHTCDPERDSASVLKHYADSLGVDTRKWVFLTGRKDSLYSSARYSYLLDDPKNSVDRIEDQFIHTQFFALVDRNGQVRGQIYDGLKKSELKLLKEHIDKVLKETSGVSGFSNSIFTNNPQ
ncbi:SCO family protein [Filimonas effusa]|uniref:SCO family protein n=1 Tax=Filimonas effusa TaxID=2508721 RepID=A0A4Q1D7U2_9BACT|nr:SCO family protein [Filimonas effusa]RXK83831.1 SCO family protein [Filimonas effusa]